MRFNTSYRLWLAIAAGIFIALSFVETVGKAEYNLWNMIGLLIRHDYHCSPLEVVTWILLRVLFQAVPAVAVGWVTQAMVVVARSVCDASHHHNTDRSDAMFP
jgi:hypothetical protein